MAAFLAQPQVKLEFDCIYYILLYISAQRRAHGNSGRYHLLLMAPGLTWSVAEVLALGMSGVSMLS